MIYRHSPSTRDYLSTENYYEVLKRKVTRESKQTPTQLVKFEREKRGRMKLYLRSFIETRSLNN